MSKITNQQILEAARDLAAGNKQEAEAKAIKDAAKAVLSKALEERGSLTHLGIILTTSTTYTVPLENIAKAFPNGLPGKNVQITKADMKACKDPALVNLGERKSWKVDAAKQPK